MTPETLLLFTAVGLAAGHTLVGVDHTLPFVVLGRARSWSLKKTLGVTAVCGLGHVFSSVCVGSVGWGLGVSTSRLATFEAMRGNWAAWLLIAFGVLLAGSGLWRLLRGNRHSHVHVHEDGTVHSHSHGHGERDGRIFHHHRHRERVLERGRGRLVPALFVIFFLGPCEALIPLMFAPAASGHAWMPWVIALSFSLTTLLTMVALVAIGYRALSVSGRLAKRLSRWEPHMGWLAGLTIALSGFLIVVLDI